MLNGSLLVTRLEYAIVASPAALNMVCVFRWGCCSSDGTHCWPIFLVLRKLVFVPISQLLLLGMEIDHHCGFIDSKSNVAGKDDSQRPRSRIYTLHSHAKATHCPSHLSRLPFGSPERVRPFAKRLSPTTVLGKPMNKPRRILPLSVSRAHVLSPFVDLAWKRQSEMFSRGLRGELQARGGCGNFGAPRPLTSRCWCACRVFRGYTASGPKN
jgi:hypothetical protein